MNQIVLYRSLPKRESTREAGDCHHLGIEMIQEMQTMEHALFRPQTLTAAFQNRHGSQEHRRPWLVAMRQETFPTIRSCADFPCAGTCAKRPSIRNGSDWGPDSRPLARLPVFLLPTNLKIRGPTDGARYCR